MKILRFTPTYIQPTPIKTISSLELKAEWAQRVPRSFTSGYRSPEEPGGCQPGTIYMEITDSLTFWAAVSRMAWIDEVFSKHANVKFCFSFGPLVYNLQSEHPLILLRLLLTIDDWRLKRVAPGSSRAQFGDYLVDMFAAYMEVPREAIPLSLQETVGARLFHYEFSFWLSAPWFRGLMEECSCLELRERLRSAELYKQLIQFYLHERRRHDESQSLSIKGLC